MIKSMTGYGRASEVVLSREATVEMRSVNNRFKDIHVRLPRNFALLEEKVKKTITAGVERGRVDAWVQIVEPADRRANLKLDLDLARAYHELLTRLQEELLLAGQTTVEQIAGLDGVIGYEEDEIDLDAFWEGFKPVLEQALENLIEMRQVEGRALAEDLQARLEVMGAWVDEIDAGRQVVIDEVGKKLETRLKSYFEGLEIDENRLLQEAAYIVDRSDITEEVVRLRSHFDQFGGLIRSRGAVGRRMEFLLQEINREVNTIGSKTGDVGITNRVLDLKTELEKIREQVQNVE